MAQNPHWCGFAQVPLSFSQNHGLPAYHPILMKDSVKKSKEANLKFLLNFDSRNSFLLNQKGKLLGLRVGLEFFKHYRFGLGWYLSAQPIPLPSVYRMEDTLRQNLRFTYSTFFFEYVIYEDFKWEFSASLPIGRGTGNIDTVSTKYDKPGTQRKGNVGVIAPSIGGHYKIFYWLGIGTGVGYRFVISPEKNVRQSLSAPFYVIKVKLFLGGLYKAIFKPQKVKEEREAWKQQRAERKKRRQERKAARQSQ